jgi:hypothetical protein
MPLIKHQSNYKLEIREFDATTLTDQRVPLLLMRESLLPNFNRPNFLKRYY